MASSRVDRDRDPLSNASIPSGNRRQARESPQPKTLDILNQSWGVVISLRFCFFGPFLLGFVMGDNVAHICDELMLNCLGSIIALVLFKAYYVYCE